MISDLHIKKSPNGLDLFLYMSEVSEDDVKVSVESNTVFVKAEGVEKLNDTRAMKKFDCEIRLPDNKYRISDIKAEMKMDLGELKLSVPKLKEENGVFNVKVNVIE
ncbi:putative alpha crystallin/Hsp20 domain, HSP20-like chaperone [Helianthus anomalus]